jgi:hypothetical protein
MKRNASPSPSGASQHSTPPGYVQADALYTLQELSRRLQLGVSALRQARRRGLVIHRVGRRGYVLGRDLIAWIEKEP